MSKLIPKYQNAWGVLNYSAPQDNTRVAPIYLELVNMKPKVIRTLAQLSSDDRSKYLKEKDKEKATQLSADYKKAKDTEQAMKNFSAFMEFSDKPLLLLGAGELAVPTLKWLGSKALYGLGKAGNKTALAALISKAMLPSKMVVPIVNPEISPQSIKPLASQFVGNNVNGEPLYMPDLEVFSKGKEMATKFFSHPVVKQSYKHNLELAKRLGVNIPDRNPADVVSKPINVKLSGASGENYAEILQSHYGDPDALIRYNWIPMTRNLLLQASIHENLHRGFYSAAPRMKSMTTDYYNNQYLPEGRFYKWKTLKLLKPEYYEGYLGDYEGGEAGPNLIDLGRELGLKLGQKYPGYKVVKEMLSKYNGYKKFIIPQLNNSRAGMRHVWDAMTGRYFVLPVIATSTLNNVYNE